MVFEQVTIGDDLVRAVLRGTAPIDGGVKLSAVGDIQEALLRLKTDAPPSPDTAKPMTGWLAGYVETSAQLLAKRLSDWQDRHKAGHYDEWYVLAEQPVLRLNLSSTVVQLSKTAVLPSLPSRAGAFVRQSVPAVMAAGHRYAVTITMRNEGSATWRPRGMHANYLGAQNPRDNTTWGHNRVKLPFSVAPAAEAVFRFTVTAPTKPGRYHFQWRMVQEHVGGFGAPSPDVVVTVR